MPDILPANAKSYPTGGGLEDAINDFRDEVLIESLERTGANIPGGGLDPNNAALTGTTTADAISPNVHDIGPIASGDVTLHATIQTNTVTLTGTSASIVLPAANNVSRKLVIDATGGAGVTISFTSMPRLDSIDQTPRTSITLPASVTKATMLFEAVGASYRGFYITADGEKISTSQLDVSTDDGSLVSPSASKVATEVTVKNAIAVAQDGITIDYDQVLNVPTGFFLGRFSPGAGEVELIELGAGVEIIDGKLVATAGGSTSPVPISGTDIAGTAGSRRTKTLSGSVAFTVSAWADGLTVTLLLTASGASRTPTWPASFDWGDQTPPTIADGESATIVITRWGNTYEASVRTAGLSIDVASPVATAFNIQALGTTAKIPFSENVELGADGISGITLNMSGGAVTPTYSSGDGTNELTVSLSRTIIDTETGTWSFTKPADGIQDASGNLLQDFVNATVTNGSSVSAYDISDNLNGPSAPAGAVVGGSPNWNYTTAPAPLFGLPASAQFGSSSQTAYWSIPAANRKRAYIIIHIGATTGGGLMYFRNGGTNIGHIVIQADGSVRTYTGTSYSVGASAGAGTFQPNTTYHVWAECETGTGSNSVMRWARETTSTFAGWRHERISGNAVLQINRFALGPDATVSHIYNKLRVGDAVIGSSPA